MASAPEHFPEQFRDCVSDVLAMTEAYLASMGEDAGEAETAAGDFRFLMDSADLVGCLWVAVPLIAAGWARLSAAWAEVKGTSADEEMALILAMFRDELAR